MFITIRSCIEYMFGKNSIQLKYICKNSHYISAKLEIRNFYIILSFIESIRKKEAEQILNDKKLAEQQDKTNKAIQYLLDRNKIIGKDFGSLYAIEVANEIAYDEAIETEKNSISPGEFVGFSGSGNCEDCSGWDGESHRCECGNRRVGWEPEYGFDFENPIVHAIAN